MNRFCAILIVAGFLFILTGCESDTDDTNTPVPSVIRVQLSEKDFIKGQYFWLTDTDSSGQPGDPPEFRKSVPNCRENYQLFSHRMHVALPLESRIIGAEFWTKSSDADSGTPGLAVNLQYTRYLNWSWEDFPEWMFGGGDKGLWRRLQPDTDYVLDTYLGVVRLKRPVLESEAFACAFASASGMFGIFAELTDTVRLILLKPTNSDPEYDTWNLMFRHVYPLGIPIADLSKLTLTISRLTGSLQEMCPPGMTMSYATYFRFDLEQPDGTAGPDGIVDNYSSLISRDFGEMHFLDLSPFDPSGFEDPPGTPHLWDFTLLEQTSGDLEGFRAPYLYTEPAYELSGHAAKWQIMAEYQLED
ncbi:hypothetical protein EHM69_04820 [candidate division KSB1 bacterium]|nr:MAG: hypothetical protein EHM69_04820 [candidate division KSB1 bacterium]